MNKIFKFFPVAFAAFALASCSSDDLMSFGQDTDAIPEVGANEAYATLDLGGTTTRSGVNIGTGENAGKYQLTWSKGDKFNLYSTNSLQFNTYTFKNWVDGNAAKGTFEIKEGDAANLSSQFTDESVANSLYAVMDDSGKGLTHSFFSNAAGEACVSVEIPKRFTQVAGAAASEDKATALCMPAFAKGVTVNAQGGVTANFKAMAGLLAIDAGDLPANTKAVIVVAEGLTGTFEANLDTDPSVKRDDRYTYGDYIQVDFNPAMTSAGSRKIYVPIPADTYANIYVYAATTLATAAANDVIKKTTWTSGALTAWELNEGAVIYDADKDHTNSETTDYIIKKENYTVSLGINSASQAISVTSDATTLEALSSLIYTKMDGEHDVTINVTTALDDITDYDTKKLYIPTNAGKKGSGVNIVFAAGDADISGKTLNIVEAEVTEENANKTPKTWSEVAADAVSGTQAREVSVSIPTTANANQVPAISVLAPTSKVTLINNAANEYAQTVTAVTPSLVLSGVAGSSFKNVVTTEKNAGEITVAANGKVATLELTKGDGLVTIDGEVTTLDADIHNLTNNIVVNGKVGTLTYGLDANPATGNVKSSGNITLGDGASITTSLTNNGTGNVTIGQLGANSGTITNKGGTLTVGNAAVAKKTTYTVGAIAQNGTGKVILQNLEGVVTSLTVNSSANTEVELNNVKLTSFVAASTSKAVNVEATDAEIETINYGAVTVNSTFNAYGSTAITGSTASTDMNTMPTDAIIDTNNKLNFYSYYTGTTGAQPTNATANKNVYIYTAGQLANLKNAPANAGFVISPEVNEISLAGKFTSVDDAKEWKGSEINHAITLDCNNVQLRNMKIVGDNKGLVQTVDADFTIKNVKLSTVYYAETAKACKNEGVLIGAINGGAVNISGIDIDDVILTSTKAGYNFGGLIGLAKGGDVTISDVALAIDQLWTAGYNVGGAIGYLQSGSANISSTVINVTTKLGGVYNVAGMIGSANVDATFGTGNKVNVKAFDTTYLSGVTAENAGTINMYVGYLNNANLTINADNIANELTKTAAQKTALGYKVRTKTALGGKQVFWGGNPWVGYVNGTATITVPKGGTQITLANNVNFNVFKYESSSYEDDTTWFPAP